jgi:hypothetical protein
MGEGEREIELQQIFRWKCLDCEHMNYHGGVSASSEEISEAVPEDLIQGGEWVLMPPYVFCEKCESKFKVQEPEMPDFPDFPFPGGPGF